MKRPLLGAHVSIAGGLSTAFDRGAELACEALQIFVKNASQWRAKPLSDDAAEAFRARHAESPVGPVVAHATYLVNLAATDTGNLKNSRRTLGDELDRCDRLGIEGLVLHPGAHLGAGEQRGLARIVKSLDHVLARRPDGAARILLEITAGQGTTLGCRLEHLALMLAETASPHRLGICIDTCHAFAAGYAIHEPTGYEEFVGRLDELCGLASVGCLHLNDSQKPFASRRDRHANLGRGEMGLAIFERLMNDRRWRQVPMVLETPRGDDGKGHERDLALLRSL